MPDAPPEEARSGVIPENLQEIIDASVSTKHATMNAQAQYETPSEWARFFSELLPQAYNEKSMFDPQCGSGNLLAQAGYNACRLGFEIDNRYRQEKPGRVNRSIGNCVKGWEALDDLFPDARFHCQVANPPFGLIWRLPDGTTADSTLYTWRKIKGRAADKGYGYFIANSKTIERLGIDKDPLVYLYQKFPVGVFTNVDVAVGVVHWQNTPALDRPAYQRLEYTTLDRHEHDGELAKVRSFHLKGFHFADSQQPEGGWFDAWVQIQKVLDEERTKRPPFNIWLGADGKLKTYLSTRTQVKHKLTRADINQIARVSDCHPLALTTDRETRNLLSELLDHGFYVIQPEAKEAITNSLAAVAALACPIMPISDFMRVAYADEEDTLVCKEHDTNLPFIPTKCYSLDTATYSFSQKFARDKVHFDEESGKTYTAKHECFLSGQDRFISIKDDDGHTHRFMDKPDKDQPYDHDEALLWSIFAQPKVNTIADANPKMVAANLELLRTCELLSSFTYYPGQLDYLARVACKDYALVAADVGTGKTLMALSLIQMKAPQRALIIAPQGTLRSSESDDDEDEVEYKASQWVEEIRRFAPGLPVFELFSYEDYQRILKANGGIMPEGVFISYYQAMFQNGALERLPESWDDLRLATEGQKILGLKKAMPLPPPPEGADAERYWCDLVGREVNGIRCILKPCLATIVGDHFDMICLDEAHICSNLDANVTQMLIRMQPKFRFAFTATPIPNIVTNLFSVMGWLCVTDWYKGERRNAAWPYARAELQRFSDTFQAKERDVTEEEMKKARNKDWRGKCEKSSPVISSPARLLKILTPTLAFISKEACNPNLVQRQIIDVRVPMGKEQSRLYAHFLDRGNIPAKSALVRARKQVAYLRNICADPAGFTHGGPRVSSNYNPKTVAILELTKEIIGRGEQVVIVCARIGQSNTLALKFKEAGLSVARIDSTVPADQHSAHSAAFKAKKAQVLIMGIKCAMGHSYDDCQNLIIGSLEYSYGAKHQAEGRIFRVNSKKNVRIYCILCKHSIEETMFDVVATKQDAATICLYGKRVPRDFKPVEMGEVLAQSMNNYQDIGVSERECEDQWPKLRAVFGRLASN